MSLDNYKVAKYINASDLDNSKLWLAEAKFGFLQLKETISSLATESKILEVGCGSGILSIYASQKGATGIGIEIDAHAADAARKNLELNEVKSFKIVTGDINTVPEMKFDIILANINRNVIEESLMRFKQALKDQGSLICSGFFTSDIEPLSAKMSAQGFEIMLTTNQDNWGMISAKPSE